MTTTSINIPTIEQQDKLRQHIETRTKEFLDRGGKITVCPDCTFAHVERAAVRVEIQKGGAE